MRRPRPRTVLIVLTLVALLGGAWLWLRDSSLVSVDRVSVAGVSGPDASQIRSTLVAAGRNMTTLDVRMDQLRTAVAPYPIVKDLSVSTQFPHGLRIRVIEQIPVGAIVVGGRTIAVAGDGTLLHDVVPAPTLPMIPLRVAPGGARLSDLSAVHAVEVLGAAPYQLLARISQVTTVAAHGLVAQLRSGPSIYFGDATRLGAKWVAATAVLADSGSAGAVYIDVSDPERPAAGAQSSGTSATGASATAAPPGTSTIPSGG
jgi:cell division protein FtsQ